VKPLIRPAIHFKSNLESDYAQLLSLRVKAGEIINWYYEPFNIRLADNTYWKPDFMLVFLTHFEFHETKGFWRRDARAKIKIAADMYPEFRFVGVQYEHNNWVYEKFS